jgi:hypothetical protein
MVIILALFISFFAHALNNVWPLLNLPLGSLTIINFLAVFLWSLLGFLAVIGFFFIIIWWMRNGILFKPSKWNSSWFVFGVVRWILISGLFYVLFLMPVTGERGSIFSDSPWVASILFLFFSLGVYDRLTFVRAWWELRRLHPDLLKKFDIEEYEINFDPVAHKLGLLRRNEWTGEKMF